MKVFSYFQRIFIFTLLSKIIFSDAVNVKNTIGLDISEEEIQQHLERIDTNKQTIQQQYENNRRNLQEIPPDPQIPVFPQSPGNQVIYVKCNSDIPDGLPDMIDMSVTEIILGASDCDVTLQEEDPPKIITIFLVGIDEADGEGNVCALQNLNADFKACTNKPALFIQGLSYLPENDGTNIYQYAQNIFDGEDLNLEVQLTNFKLDIDTASQVVIGWGVVLESNTQKSIIQNIGQILLTGMQIRNGASTNDLQLQIKNVVVQVILTNSKFINNFNEKGSVSAIDITSAAKIVVLDCLFKGNMQNSQGAIQLTGVLDCYFKNLRFEKNKVFSIMGSGLTLQGCVNIFMTDIQLVQNDHAIDIYPGGVLTFIYCGNVMIFNVTSSGNISKINSSQQYTIFLYQSTGCLVTQSHFDSGIEMGGVQILESNIITVTDCEFTNIVAQKISGMGIKSADVPVQTYANLVFNNNRVEASEQGGSMFLRNKNVEVTGGLTITNLQFYDQYANFGAGLSISNFQNCQSCVISYLTFQNCNAYPSDGGAMFIDYSQNFSIFELTIENCSSGDLGGGIKTSNIAVFEITNITLRNNHSQNNGGGICLYSDTTSTTLRDITFENNSAEAFGGGLSIEKSSDLTLESITFRKNYSKVQGGSFYINQLDDSTLSFIDILDGETGNGNAYWNNVVDSTATDINVIGNRANESSAGMVVSNSNNFNISRLLIRNNESDINNGGVLFLNNRNMEISNVEILENYAVMNGGGVAFQNNNYLTVRDFLIKDNNCTRFGGGSIIQFNKHMTLEDITIRDNVALNKGGGIQMGLNDDCILNNVKILENQSKQGGGIYCSLQNRLTINDMILEDNVSTGLAGGAQFLDVTDLEINRSYVRRNIAQTQGGGLYFTEKCDGVWFRDGEIIDNTTNMSGGGVSFVDILSAKFENTLFKNNVGPQSGGAVDASSVVELIFENVVVKNHQSENGGFLNGQNIGTLQILNSNFTDNVAVQQGGAINYFTVDNFIVQNSFFERNEVNKEGKTSTMHLKKGGTICGLVTEQFDFIDSEITDSYAHFQGGGMFLQNVQNLNIQNCKFLRNKVFFDKNIVLFEKNDQHVLSQGGGIHFDYSLEEIPANISFRNLKFSECYASSGGGIFVHQSQVNQLDRIQFEVDTVYFTNIISDIGPGIRFIGQYTNNYKKNVRQLFQQQKEYEAQVDPNEDLIYFGFFKNEKRSSQKNYAYQLCQDGSYLQEGGPFYCKKCVDNGECNGGYIPISPKKHYWRENTDQLNFIECELNRDVCLGNDTCAEGNVGILCESCDGLLGYSINFKNECDFCKEDNNYVFLLFVVFFLSMLVVLQQIYGTNSKIRQRVLARSLKNLWNYYLMKFSQLSGISKIVILHLQVIYLTDILNLDFPLPALEGLSIVGNPAESFSLKSLCINRPSNLEEQKKQIFNTFAIGFSLTFLILIFLLTCNLIFGLIKRFTKAKLLSQIICTCICFFITVQPGYLQNSLSFIMCRTIANKKYSKADNWIECDSGFYLTTVLPFNLIIALLFGITIPGGFLYVITKTFKEKRENRMFFQRAFGILFLEHKPDKYYMEIISITLKITVVLISIIYEQNLIVKGCLICLVIISYSYYCFQKWPFLTNQLNKLSILASIVQVVTIMLGMCTQYLEEDDNASIKYIILTIIYLSNTVFFGYCAYMVLSEARIILRKFILSHEKFVPQKLVQYMKNWANRDKIAKQRWKKIQEAINKTNTQKRRNECNFDHEYEQILYNSLNQVFTTMKNSKKEVKVNQAPDGSRNVLEGSMPLQKQDSLFNSAKRGSNKNILLQKQQSNNSLGQQQQNDTLQQSPGKQSQNYQYDQSSGNLAKSNDNVPLETLDLVSNRSNKPLKPIVRQLSENNLQSISSPLKRGQQNSGKFSQFGQSDFIHYKRQDSNLQSQDITLIQDVDSRASLNNTMFGAKQRPQETVDQVKEYDIQVPQNPYQDEYKKDYIDQQQVVIEEKHQEEDEGQQKVEKNEDLLLSSPNNKNDEQNNNKQEFLNSDGDCINEKEKEDGQKGQIDNDSSCSLDMEDLKE